MPQVASDASSVVANFSPPSPPPRPAPAADQAPVTPFESMLDDTAQIAADQPPPADHDHQPDPSDQPAKASPGRTVDDKPKADKTKIDKVKTDKAKIIKAKDDKTKSDKAAKAAKSDNSGKAKTTDNSEAVAPVVKGGKVVTTKAAVETEATDKSKMFDCKSPDATIADAAPAAVTPVIQPDAGNALAAAIAPPADPAAPQGPVAKDAPISAAAVAVNLSDLVALKPSPAKSNDGKAQAAPKTDDTAKSGLKAPDADPSAPVQNDAKSDGKAQVAEGNTGKNAAVHPQDAAPAHRADLTDVAANTNNADTTVAKAASAAQAVTATPATSQPAAPQPAAQPAPQIAAVPLAGIAIEIAGKALDGKNRFEIRLDPPELGRIDVRLDVSRDGRVTSHLTVDRADTLDLLRRDASGLERALQDAGLKTSDNGLQFSLRDQSMGQRQDNSPLPGSAQIVVEDDALSATAAPSRYARYAGMGGGIDIRV